MAHSISRNPNYQCPHCGGTVLRIERLWRDRVINMFMAVRRFRCEQFGCGWEGRIAISKNSRDESKRPLLHLTDEKKLSPTSSLGPASSIDHSNLGGDDA